MEITIKFDDESTLIALSSISNELELDNIEEVIEYLIETYDLHKEEIRKKVKLKKRRGF